jgi:hypothetical protein
LGTIGWEQPSALKQVAYSPQPHQSLCVKIAALCLASRARYDAHQKGLLLIQEVRYQQQFGS